MTVLSISNLQSRYSDSVLVLAVGPVALEAIERAEADYGLTGRNLVGVSRPIEDPEGLMPYWERIEKSRRVIIISAHETKQFSYTVLDLALRAKMANKEVFGIISYPYDDDGMNNLLLNSFSVYDFCFTHNLRFSESDRISPFDDLAQSIVFFNDLVTGTEQSCSKDIDRFKQVYGYFSEHYLETIEIFSAVGRGHQRVARALKTIRDQIAQSATPLRPTEPIWYQYATLVYGSPLEPSEVRLLESELCAKHLVSNASDLHQDQCSNLGKAVRISLIRAKAVT